MGTYFRRRDLERLRELRAALLGMEERAAGEPAPRYWRSSHDLELYDATFARRIAWKWEAVLDELEARDVLAPLVAAAADGVLDWGCGTGVATRAWLARAGGAPRVTLWDRAPDARAFALARVREEHPDAEAEPTPRPPARAPGLLLVSHVLDELDDAGAEALVALARSARAVVWVEPGSRATSRRLSELREALRTELALLAPCPHQARCGMLSPGNERHWCHLFGRSAPEAFTDGAWAELARELSIDLRSLPYSFLALARDGAPALPPGAARVLGRPRHQRGAVTLDLCRADGVHAVRLLERTAKPLVKRLAKAPEEPWLLDVELQGDRVRVAERLSPPSR